MVGRSRHGKGPATERVLARWRAAGLRVGGFEQRVLADGFELVDLLEGERCTLASRTTDSPDICDFAFAETAIALGRSWIARAAAARADVLLLEVGKLEARGEVHWPAVLDALRGPQALVVLRVRPDVLFAVADKLVDPVEGLELPADEVEIDRFADATTEIALAQRARL
ncbi:MAG: hypothetical protein KC503_07025 [Myxococcales bacterium]|nr:hypothetical protein [Myxococcales bacterium]